MSNVGFVIYTRGKEPGSLDAKFRHSKNGSGTGVLTGGPTEGFTGSYQARYFNEAGIETFVFDLIIEKNGETYDLTWRSNGETGAVGIGREVGGGLAVGYCFV